MIDITLPALPGGAARVLRWLVAAGASVEMGAPLVIVLTEQVEVVFPAPVAGTLAGPVDVGAQLDPGALLGRIEPVGLASGTDPLSGRSTPYAQPEETSALRRRPRATALARSIARVHGIDLAAVVGTGPHGCIRAADVRALLPAPVFAPAGAPSPDPSIRRSSAPTDSRSLDLPRPQAPEPHPPLATAAVEFDATAALAIARGLTSRLTRDPREPAPSGGSGWSGSPSALSLWPAPLGLLARVVEAAAALLPLHQLLNARWGGEVIVLRRRVHIAVAAPGDSGALRWSLVRDAGDLATRGVARALAAPPATSLGAATFAVVGLAPGATWQSAPPLPGTAAALCLSVPEYRAVARGEHVAVRPLAVLTLSYDARVLDHHHGAAFLCELRRELERGG